MKNNKKAICLAITAAILSTSVTPAFAKVVGYVTEKDGVLYQYDKTELKSSIIGDGALYAQYNDGKLKALLDDKNGYIDANDVRQYIINEDKIDVDAYTESDKAEKSTITEAEVKKVDKDGNVIEKPVEEGLKVESVSAINATQVEVKFSKAVDKATLFADGKSGAFKADVVTFKSLDSKEVEALTGKLSEDGKILTITAGKATSDGAQTIFEGRYDVTVDKVKGLDGNAIVKYEGKNLDFGKDEVAPTIKEVEKVNASTVKVHFSEPLSAEGNWTFKDKDGKDVTVTKAFTAGDSAVKLTIADADLKAGAEITATVLGAKDQAGNLLSPNPSKVTFTKGDKDGIAPVVKSVTALGLDKFEIKFSEEVEGLKPSLIKIGGIALSDTDDVLKQDKEDKTKYTVTLKTAKTAGLHKIELDKDAVNDLSGEGLKAFSQLVEFKADTVAPKFVSSEVIENDNKEEVLVLTFDKEVVKPAAFSTQVATELNKDFITTKGNLTAGQLDVNAKNKKQLEVKLNTVKFTPDSGSVQDLVKDATYTVKFAEGDIKDANTNKVKEFEITFKRGEDGTATVDAPKVSSATATNPDTITVVFDKVLDGKTAINVANYTIPGLVIEKATLTKDSSGDANTVVLTLKEGTNELDGDRDITIKNVKAKDGEVMKEETRTVVGMKENVRPTVVSAKFSDTDENGKVKEITITFSEKVEVVENAFELFVGDLTTAEATTNTAVSGSDNAVKELKISITSPLDTDAIAKGITVKLADDKEVKDVNSNLLDFESIKATK